MFRRKVVVAALVFGLFAAMSEVNAQIEFRWTTVTDAFGESLAVKQNVQTGAAHRVYGEFVNIARYGVPPADLSLQNIDDVAREFLSDYRDIIRVGPDNLRTLATIKAEGNWYVSYEQIYQGIPVFSSRVGFTIENDGTVRCVGADVYPNIEVATAAAISSSRAVQIAKADFQANGAGEAKPVGPASLLIYPELVDMLVNYHLAYRVELLSSDSSTDWIYFIDALSGDILRTADAFRSGDWNIYGQVWKKYFPEHESDSPVTYGPVSAVEISIFENGGRQEASGQTNSNGLYDIDWTSPNSEKMLKGTKNLNLSNAWCRIVNGDTVSHEYVFDPSHATRHDWSWATDETNVFYHVQVAHDYWTGSPLNFGDMDYQMNATVHAGASVNGKSTGNDIKFGNQWGVNWSLYSDVVYHEYAHCVIFHIYTGWIQGTTEACAMDEGFPDYFACSMNGDPMWGDGIVGVPGVPRNLNNSLNKIEDWEPGECYLNGRIIAGACWDMRQSLGAPTADKLVFEALRYEPHAYWFDDFADNVLLVDCSFYGGAHWQTIDSCFSRHGINSSIDIMDCECQQKLFRFIAGSDTENKSMNNGDYFPLQVGNTWYYGYPIPPSNPWEVRMIRDSLFIDGRTYYIWTYGEGVDIFDTLRADEQGNIWKYHGGRDYLWFDFQKDSGAVYYFPPLDIGETEGEKCKVYVRRNFQVKTPAGTFDNCISFKFDIYQEKDEEMTYTFAEDVGPIAITYGFGGTARLTLAVVNGKIVASVKHTKHRGEITHWQPRNYPNPFNSCTTIQFNLSERAFVRLRVFDVLGHHLRTLVEGKMAAGAHSVSWDGRDTMGRDLPSGVYFYLLEQEGRTQVGKMVLMR